MLTTTAIISGKPGTGNDLEAVLRVLAASTQDEEGCLLFSLQRSLDDPDTFVTVEKWRSVEDLDLHSETSHVAAGVAAARHMLADGIRVIPTVILETGDKSTY